jgi:hypothetical protein
VIAIFDTNVSDVAGERSVHTGKVAGSIPAVPTIFLVSLFQSLLAVSGFAGVRNGAA